MNHTASIADLNHLIICGKIPFAVLCEDGMSSDGKLMIDKGIEIVSSGKEFRGMLFTKKEVNRSHTGIISATEDYYGDFSYSLFQLLIRKEDVLKGSFEDYLDLNDPNSFLESCVTLVQKFVRAYRSCSHPEKDWVTIPQLERLTPLKIVFFDKYKKEIRGSYTRGSLGTGVGLGSCLSNEAMDAVRSFCVTPDPKIDIARHFMQEANRYRRLGDLNTSLIFLQAYLEKFVFREVRLRLVQIGYTDVEIEKSLRKDEFKYIHWIKAVAFFDEKKSFLDSKEYKIYIKNVSNLRDEIIHRDSIEIDRDQINKSGDAAMALVELLRSIIHDPAKTRIHTKK